MALNNMNEGMGKKIVEALKMQSMEHSDGEIFINEENDEIVEPHVEEYSDVAYETTSKSVNFENSYDSQFVTPKTIYPQNSQMGMPANKDDNNIQNSIPSIVTPTYVDTAFQQSLARNLGQNVIDTTNDDFEYPTNVAILKQLIAKLPTGVSKQTGALIIKQTMEALGISINSVLQEAKQVQDTLICQSKECQNNIIEYRKQISILEVKAQQFQRQSIAMNDIINLFLQTSK